MYKVNIEGCRIIDHITIPVLVIYKGSKPKVMIGNEVTGDEKEEVILKKDIQEWLDTNIKGNYCLIRAFILFEHEDEAVLFKTTWI